MHLDPGLRPIERRVLRLTQGGMAEEEVASRFRRSPEMIHRLVALAKVPRSGGRAAAPGDVLRPLERRVLRWRAAGAAYDDIGPRFRRSADFVKRVEDLARYKLSRS
jgi:DNA-binding CsgD family transcriptional regulator